MRPLRPDEDPLDVVIEMVGPDHYGVVQGWQVCCRLLKDAIRRRDREISDLKAELFVLRAAVKTIDDRTALRSGEEGK